MTKVSNVAKQIEVLERLKNGKLAQMKRIEKEIKSANAKLQAATRSLAWDALCSLSAGDEKLRQEILARARLVAGPRRAELVDQLDEALSSKREQSGYADEGSVISSSHTETRMVDVDVRSPTLSMPASGSPTSGHMPIRRVGVLSELSSASHSKSVEAPSSTPTQG